MNASDNVPAFGDLIPITEVERQTGIRQATLRMWEKRYGFPQPLRDRHGDRVYPPGQVERLKAVSRMIDQGLRPGKIFSGAFEAGAAEVPAPPTHPDGVPERYRRIFELLREYRLAELHGLFQHRLLDLGLRRFTIEFLAPLSSEVGSAWSRGELPVRAERVFSQLAMAFLHAKQAEVRVAGDGRPKVLLATLTGESHVLGIMMVEAVMATLEMDCIQLGGETPPIEVAAAARETDADLVALSFSSYFPRRSMARLVAALRGALPPSATLWIGGEGASDSACLFEDVHIFSGLDEIEPGLRELFPSRGQAPR